MAMGVPRSIRWAAALAALVVLVSVWIVARHDGPLSAASWVPVRAGRAGSGAVALTFEVAWGEHEPAKVLGVLESEQAPATFFVAGSWAAGHPRLVSRMANLGTVGVLGWRAARMSKWSTDQIRSDLDRTTAWLVRTDGTAPIWFRPPDGDYDVEVVRTAAHAGLATVLWSTDPHDEGQPDTAVISTRVLAHAKPGAIIRLHADDGAPAVDAALPAIVQGLRASGLRLVSLDQLLGRQMDHQRRGATALPATSGALPSNSSPASTLTLPST